MGIFRRKDKGHQVVDADFTINTGGLGEEEDEEVIDWDAELVAADCGGDPTCAAADMKGQAFVPPSAEQEGLLDSKGHPVVAVAEIALAMVFVGLLFRALWLRQSVTEGVQKSKKAAEKAVDQEKEKKLKANLEKEAKAKKGLSDQNAILKAAIEEQKATVQMFTSELQNRDEQLATFEKEQRKVKQELTSKIEALKGELQSQEKVQQENLNTMEKQCSELASKVSELMSELQSREEQWKAFEQQVKAKEAESVAQVQSLKSKLQAQEKLHKENLGSKENQCTDLTTKLEILTKELEVHEQRLNEFKQQREKWSETTKQMQTRLEAKKQQCQQLQAKLGPLRGELQTREGQVAELEQRVKDSEEMIANDMDNRAKTLEAHRAERDKWTENSMEIKRLLKDKAAEIVDLKAKMEAVKEELKVCEEQVAAIEAEVKVFEASIAERLAPLTQQLEATATQREEWKTNTIEISRLMQEQQHQVAQLQTRVDLFQRELEVRDERVTTMKSLVLDQSGPFLERIDVIKQEMAAKASARDTWKNNTDDIQRLLGERKAQISGLVVRLDLFNKELKVREERVASLSAMLEENEYKLNCKLLPQKKELDFYTQQRDEWKAKTDEIIKLLNTNKGQIVGLNTRLTLFRQELKNRQDAMDAVEAKLNEVSAHDEMIAGRLKPLREQLASAEAARDEWMASTMQVDRLLKEQPKKIPRLATRLQLFQSELDGREKTVASLEVNLRDTNEVFDSKIKALKAELDAVTAQRDEWKQSTSKVEATQQEKKDNCTNLMGKLNQFMGEIGRNKKRLAHLEVVIKDKEAYFTEQIQSLKDGISGYKEGRDVWVQNLRTVNKALMERRHQCVGLSTRLALFNRELETREKVVKDLEGRIRNEEELSITQKESLEKELAIVERQRDEWMPTAMKMHDLVKERKQQVAGLRTRYMLFEREYKSRTEQVSMLEIKIKDKEGNYKDAMEPIKKELREQRERRDKWNETTLDIDRILKDREEQVANMSTKLQFYMSDLQRSQEVVANLEKKLQEPGSADDRSVIQYELRSQQDQRDKRIQASLETNRSIKETRDQVRGLKTRLDLFVRELQTREDQVSMLETKVEEKEALFVMQMEPIKAELVAQKEHRDKWRESTKEINSLLRPREAELTGMTTRLELFIRELQTREERVAEVEAKLRNIEELTIPHIARLKKDLEENRTQRDKWTNSTTEIKRLLRDKSDEGGVKTRIMVFERELKMREDALAAHEQKIQDAVDNAAAVQEDLKNKIKTEEAQRDHLIETTLEINRTLESEKGQVAGLETRLALFTRELQRREELVKVATAKLEDKQEVATMHLRRVQKELQAAREQRDEWREKTLALSRSLAETKGSVAGLTTRVGLFVAELQVREEAVEALEAKVQECESQLTEKAAGIHAELRVKRAERDEWAEKTAEVGRLLNLRRGQVVGLTTRLALFQREAKTYEEATAKLEPVALEVERTSACVDETNKELPAVRKACEEWRASTQEVDRLLRDRKGQVIGLTTRMGLFKEELQSREDQVADCLARIKAIEAEMDTKNEHLNNELQLVVTRRDEWKRSADAMKKLQQDKKHQIIGLTTRVQLFERELKTRDEQVRLIEETLDDGKARTSVEMAPLMEKLHAAQAERDALKLKLDDLNRLLGQAESQVLGLNTRSELYDTELASREELVSKIEAGMKTAQEGFDSKLKALKGDLEKEVEARDKLKKEEEEASTANTESQYQLKTLNTNIQLLNYLQQEGNGE